MSDEVENAANHIAYFLALNTFTSGLLGFGMSVAILFLLMLSALSLTVNICWA